VLGGGRGLTRMLETVGNRFNRPILLEAQGLEDPSVPYQTCDSFTAYFVRKLGSKESVPRDDEQQKLDSVLANLTKQTSLEFAREIRPFDMCLVTETGEPSGVNAGNASPQ
jgi:hypothetical protein